MVEQIYMGNGKYAPFTLENIDKVPGKMHFYDFNGKEVMLIPTEMGRWHNFTKEYQNLLAALPKDVVEISSKTADAKMLSEGKAVIDGSVVKPMVKNFADKVMDLIKAAT